MKQYCDYCDVQVSDPYLVLLFKMLTVPLVTGRCSHACMKLVWPLKALNGWAEVQTGDGEMQSSMYETCSTFEVTQWMGRSAHRGMAEQGSAGITCC